MERSCNVDQLSAEQRWEELFTCLGIDQNATIDLTELRVPNTTNTVLMLKDFHRGNILEIILSLIWLVDQFLFVALVLYCALFAFIYLRLLLSPMFFKCLKCFKMKSK